MQMGTLGPLPNVQIMEMSLFLSVLINRFHCIISPNQAIDIYSNEVKNRHVQFLVTP